jgi:hypothetical protein
MPRVLAVKGRTSGRWRTTPVNLLTHKRAYLTRWNAEAGIFFEGTGPDSSDDQLRAIAPGHPAFEVLPVQ